MALGADCCADRSAGWGVGRVLSGNPRGQSRPSERVGVRIRKQLFKMATILKAENLEKVYRVGKVDVPALRGVSLDVEEGEFLSVMGPSGCGKSTMLHLLGGLLTPTKGRIVIAGEDLTAASDPRRTDIRR